MRRAGGGGRVNEVIDANVPRFNQACVAALTGIAFVVQSWPLVAIVAIVLGTSRFLGPKYALFTQVYVRALRPRLRGAVVTKPAAPAAFAQLLGVVLLSLATVLLIVEASAAGWIVTLAVTALASLGGFGGVCVGCIIYDKATDRS